MRPLLTSSFRYATVWALVAGGYSVLAVLKEASAYSAYADVPASIEAILTFALGLLLALRTNVAHQRWWEARTLWGTLVNASRNLAVKAKTLVTAPDSEHAELGEQISRFAETLRESLERPVTAAARTGGKGEPESHEASRVAGRVYAILERWRREHHLTTETVWMLDREARQLLEVCGACERIRRTLPPPSYRKLVLASVVLYIVSLPWGLAETFGWWTVPVVALATLLSVAVERTAHDVEQPFGESEDDLDLAAICATIRGDMSQILGANRLDDAQIR